MGTTPTKPTKQGEAVQGDPPKPETFPQLTEDPAIEPPDSPNPHLANPVYRLEDWCPPNPLGKIQIQTPLKQDWPYFKLPPEILKSIYEFARNGSLPQVCRFSYQLFSPYCTFVDIHGWM